MKTGAELIRLERLRQMTDEHFDNAHDDGHIAGQLSAAGASYAMAASAQIKFGRENMNDILAPSQWPWEPEWWKLEDDPVRTLVKAGALIAAEIDRLQRMKK